MSAPLPNYGSPGALTIVANIGGGWIVKNAESLAYDDPAYVNLVFDSLDDALAFIRLALARYGRRA